MGVDFPGKGVDFPGQVVMGKAGKGVDFPGQVVMGKAWNGVAFPGQGVDGRDERKENALWAFLAKEPDCSAGSILPHRSLDS